eukprot:TRINITY_DN240_c0_g1_i1.p1 TRINITY_DN240_c0_g1~~TRINITY_DN240_c0_g1_i1.p1  ORF type:complete len:1429 (-),score=152.52 TRINITY_DN240_c0_g1_i1:4268-8554(-)
MKAFNTGRGFSILAVKFLKGKRTWVIWSDAGGEIIITEFVKALLGYNVNHISVIHEAYGFSLNPLFPNELYPTKLDDLTLVAIAGIGSVYVVNIGSQAPLLWEYKRKDVSKHSLPYIDWGRGALPGDLENSNLVLAIGWDKTLQLVEIREPFHREEGYVYTGYYESEYEINALYWISESVLLIVNSMKEIKVLYTGNFAPGKRPEGHLGSRKSVEKKGEELEKPYKVSQELIAQVAKLGKEQVALRNTYHQTIARKGHQVLGLTKTGPLEAKLYTWNEFLEEQRGKSQWIHALSVSIEVYSGALKGFANIPERKDLREETLKAFMKNFLCDSWMEDLEKDAVAAVKPNSPTDGIATMTQIQVTIEYCIIISAFDLLFKTLFGIFCDYELEYTFLQAMEPFVLAGKFGGISIPKDVFETMLDYYLKQNRTQVLEQMLLALNLENQDLQKLADLCITHKLFSALIYVKTLENEEEQFIEPLIYMCTEMRLKQKDNDTLKLDSIYSNPKQAETSAIYLGYKVLWYIDLCFKGQKYPYRTNQISFDLWPRVVYGIINWVFLEQNGSTNLKELMRKDLLAVLQVFKGLFENEATRGFLREPEKYKSKVGYGFDYLSVLDKIKRTVNELSADDPNVLRSLHRFIGKVAAIPGIDISPEWCIETAKGLAETIDESFNKRQSEEAIIGLLKNQRKGLKVEDINALIEHFLPTPHTEVVIYLWEVKGEYTKCFDAFLDAKDSITSYKIFGWLQHINELLEDSNDDYEQLKSAIYERLERLLSLDMNKTADVVDTWFKHQHEEVIEKLKKQPILQLDYVLRVLNDKEQEISKVFKDYSMSGKETEEYKRFYRIITLNVELLCDYKPGEVMLHIKKKWYPTQLCLEICEKKGHSEAVAFLLKRSGAFAESLDSYLKILNQLYEHMKDDSKKDYIDKNALEFRKYFDCALKVCKKHAKVTGNEESEQGLWFLLLDNLYDMWLTLYKLKAEKTGKESYAKLANLNLVSTTLNECIKTLLGSMMESVSFPTILTRVTEKHGELEISSFKDMFASMLLTYFYQEKILDTAKGIVGTGVVKEFNQLNKVRAKGVFLKHTYCAKCGTNIGSSMETEAITFSCGHIYHNACLRNKEGCYVCMYGEKSTFKNLIRKKIETLSLDQLMKKRAERRREEEESARAGEDSEKESKLQERARQHENERKRKAMLNNRREEYINRQRIFEKMKVKSFYVFFYIIKGNIGELFGKSNTENAKRIMIYYGICIDFLFLKITHQILVRRIIKYQQALVLDQSYNGDRRRLLDWCIPVYTIQKSIFDYLYHFVTFYKRIIKKNEITHEESTKRRRWRLEHEFFCRQSTQHPFNSLQFILVLSILSQYFGLLIIFKQFFSVRFVQFLFRVVRQSNKYDQVILQVTNSDVDRHCIGHFSFFYTFVYFFLQFFINFTSL